MTQEDKELLLKDLAARLPYGVKILNNGWDFEFSTVETLIGIDDRFIYTLWRDEKDKHSIGEPLSILDYKPYLRPLSSMTEEEREELEHLSEEYFGKALDKQIQESLSSSNRNESEILECIASSVIVDWLNFNHFDFRGLISKNLAIEVTEENDPYKE